MRFWTSGFLNNSVVPGPINHIKKKILFSCVFAELLAFKEKISDGRNVIGCDLWDQVQQIYAKNQRSKISFYCPFKGFCQYRLGHCTTLLTLD